MPIRSLAKNYSQKNFTGGQRTTRWMGSDSCSIFNHIFPHYIISMTDNKISVQLMAALCFKWNPLWHLVSILDNQVYT